MTITTETAADSSVEQDLSPEVEAQAGAENAIRVGGPSDDRMREVIYGRDWYVEEYEIIASEDAVSLERLMRRHFAAWADQLVTATLGPNGGEAQWSQFREHMADPDLYPGGRDELLADAIHAEAARRLWPRITAAINVARQELLNLERDQRSLEVREICPFCQRKRGGVDEHHTGRVGLDTRKLCDTCVDLAQREHKAWKSTPAPTRDSW